MIYYGYKRGDDSKIVDWSSVSSDITEKLGEVEAKRAAEREKIEGEIAAAQQSINDIPMGNYEDINNFMLKFSNAAAEQMRVNNTLLRNGQMKPSEYTPFRQNVMDAAVSYKKIAENYNSMMDEFTLRQQENKAGGLEAWQAGIVQDMADLSNTIPVIDPVTGKVFNAPIGADGKPDMKKAMSVRDMQNMAYQKYDIFDMEAQLNPIVDKYGKDVRVINKLGVKTKEDITARKDFEKSVDTAISQYSDEQLASVLVDYADKYKFTDDPSADKSEFIQLGRDGRLANRLLPTLTDDQKKEARDIIKEQLYMKLDYVETPAPKTSGGAPSSAQIAAGKAKEKAKGYVTALQDLFTAKDPKKRAAAMANLAGAVGQDKFISMEMNDAGDAIIFTGIDDEGNIRKPQQIPLEGTFDDFVKNYGKILTGTNDVWTYYDEVIDSPDVSSLTPSVGAGGKYEIGFEEDLSQKLIPFSTVTKTIEGSLPNYTIFTDEDSRYRQVSNYVDKYKVASNIEGLKYKRDGNNIVLTLDGLGSVSMNVKQTTDATRDNLNSILLKINEAATTGKPLEGVTEPADPDGDEDIDYSNM